MAKKIAIVQSNYIPWKGYFDLIRSVDEFIVLDDVQYTKRDWRNRNQIKSPSGLLWLTIPVKVAGRYHQAINETVTVEDNWRKQHWQSIVSNYSRSPYFEEYSKKFEPFYRADSENFLSRINRHLMEIVCGILEIKTKLSWSTDYELLTGRNERLLSLCLQAGASEYVSGPSAQSYLDIDSFRKAGVNVTFFNYAGYPEYRQSFGKFEHAVSIIDLIFNEGPKAVNFLERTKDHGSIP